MRLPRRRSPLERLGAVRRYAERDHDAPLEEQVDRLADRIAEVSGRLARLERQLRAGTAGRP